MRLLALAILGLLALGLIVGVVLLVEFLIRENKAHERTMKALPVVLNLLAIYALFHLTVQSFRHAFVLWVEPRSSVLLKYEITEHEILAAKSLEELVTLYEEAREKVKQWEQGKSEKEKREARSADQEPYIGEWKLKQAIRTWESQHREIYQLHFYWWCGFGLLALGLATCVWANRWLGLGWLITAFAEMIWWTSPSFNFFSTQEEFDRLVLWKFIYSVGSLALLLGLWYYLTAYFLRQRPAGELPPVRENPGCSQPVGAPSQS